MRTVLQSKFLVLSVSTLSFISCSSKTDENKSESPNILFICVDDLRKELGCYGSTVKTPNIDKLASQGSLFFNHYAQVPTSGASRASMLTGHLPKQKSDLRNEACYENISNKSEAETPETMFHHLRRNGYYTVGIGKISHSADGYIYRYDEKRSDVKELPHSWDELCFDAGKWKTGWNAFFGYSDGTNRQGMKKNVKPYECAHIDGRELPDGHTTRLAVGKIKELADKKQPFCLAVGYFKPHLPFVAPQKYWDMYDEASLPLSPMKDIPEGCNLLTLHASGEINGYLLGDEKVSLNENVSDEYARKLRHAYFACISYIDDQVGQLLDVLDECGLSDNTVVVLWGDHGWHLGDLRVWGKHTLFEKALNSCLIVKSPTCKKGIKNTRIISSIDIYPTLMDLCGVQKPSGLDGKSFVNLLNNPNDSTWTDQSYSYFNDGVSLRTSDYRISVYDKKGYIFTELYRYDDDCIEKKNVADENNEILEEHSNLKSLILSK